MLIKFTWPRRPEMGDIYLKADSAVFVRDRGELIFELDGNPHHYDEDGLEVYILDPVTGKTVDRPKLPTRGAV